LWERVLSERTGVIVAKYPKRGMTLFIISWKDRIAVEKIAIPCWRVCGRSVLMGSPECCREQERPRV
jgi:hypothetical protein